MLIKVVQNLLSGLTPQNYTFRTSLHALQAEIPSSRTVCLRIFKDDAYTPPQPGRCILRYSILKWLSFAADIVAGISKIDFHIIPHLPRHIKGMLDEDPVRFLPLILRCNTWGPKKRVSFPPAVLSSCHTLVQMIFPMIRPSFSSTKARSGIKPGWNCMMWT